MPIEFPKMHFDPITGDPVGTGYRPVDTFDEEDLENELKRARGPGIDMERLMAMPPRDTFQWRWLDKVLKIYHKNPDYKWVHQYQQYGTCVGQASKVSADDQMAMNALLYGMEFPGRAAVAGSYTFARVEIEGRPGPQEGANGVNAATAFLKLGVLLLKHIGLPDDSRDEDENLAMKWTNSRQGVPQQYELMARNQVVANVVRPTGTREAGKLIQGGAGIFVGTTLIPTGQCNAKGISPCRRSRQGHEMAIRGGHLGERRTLCFSPTAIVVSGLG